MSGEWALPGFTEVDRLGEGSFGRVVLARQDRTGHLVAIKYLFARHLDDPRLVDAFRQEARVLSQVISPHVARLHEFIETPQGAAIVMEAVPGVPLREILRSDGTLDPEAALAVLKGSLLGLSAAHHAGIVHRDYKPDNVLVDAQRQSKLVDFGIAVLAGQAGLSVGTPAYMAPEQWSGNTASPATDVYAATCVFFQCVAGHRPFEADSTEVLRNLHAHAPIPFGEAPEPVRGLITRGMAKNPAERPASADAFLTELESTAVAAYGRDWEERGWGRLAQRAGALLALSPLAMLAGASVVAPAGAGAAAVAGSGGVAAAGAGGGVLVKAGAILAGAALVGTGVVVVVANSGEEPPPVVQNVALQVNTNTTTDRAPGSTVDVNAQFLTVNGGSDPAVVQRINNALREPVDRWVAYISRSAPEWGPNTEGPPSIGTDATIGLHNDDLLSVRYTHKVANPPHSTWTFKTSALTFDLHTGDLLNPDKLLRPEKLNPPGMAELAEVLWPGGDPCGEKTGTPAIPVDTLTDPDSIERPVEALLTPDGVEFAIEMQSFGGSTACGVDETKVSYDSLGGLFAPGVLAKVDAVPPSSAPPSSRTTGAAVKLDVGPLTLEVPPTWTRRSQGLEQVIVDAAECADPVKYFNCRYFMVTDNTKANAEQPAYVPGKPYRRSSNGRACNAAGRKDLWQNGNHTLQEATETQVGGRPARFERWTVECVPRDANGGVGEVRVTQRIWFVPDSDVVIVDEWDVPGLAGMLNSAEWN
ncbi:serine/threonine-protein kinase [Amycolatopsis magusensis]|uniref:non-specific serine/threonine protein kinase n=1 Tax=Amycolatopsis magusensis TaxID=882444 RepID=A0ABS4PJR1_9PSEU|nr:serine/threonine-protein kinase [Amycolatopsis magusensis]MBP2179667.1 serine/threonine-protein kinase [Amycolatopsis magusensis]